MLDSCLNVKRGWEFQTLFVSHFNFHPFACELIGRDYITKQMSARFTVFKTKNAAHTGWNNYPTLQGVQMKYYSSHHKHITNTHTHTRVWFYPKQFDNACSIHTTLQYAENCCFCCCGDTAVDAIWSRSQHVIFFGSWKLSLGSIYHQPISIPLANRIIRWKCSS